MARAAVPRLAANMYELGKLGHAQTLREDHRHNMKRAAARWGHFGPYMPVIYQACQETEFAYEYRHGAASYGAFTYSLVQELRSASSRRGVSFKALLGRVTKRLKDLDYAQQPNLVGPSRVIRRRASLGAGARR